MSSIRRVPAMAYSPHYHIQQQRPLDILRQSSFNSNLPAKPLPIADVAIPSKPLSNEPHRTNIHVSSVSHLYSPRAVHPLSESSIGSYSQSASPTSERNQQVPLDRSNSPEAVQEHRDHWHIKDAGYAVRNTRVQDQLPSDRSSHVQPAGHTTFTYTPDESLDEDIEPGDHTLWILVS